MIRRHVENAQHGIPKLVTGIADMTTIFEKGDFEKPFQLQLDMPDMASVEIEVSLQARPPMCQVFMTEISLIIEIKDMFDDSTEESSYRRLSLDTSKFS